MEKQKKIFAFIAVDIACFLTVLDSTIVNVSLPGMATYFHATATTISWVSTAYLIAFSSLLINFSKIADIYGRKKLFLIGLILFGIASASCGIAPSLPILIGCRILQGVGAAILTPLSIPLGIELYGKKAMGKLAVIIGMTISISAASGPLIGGILNETFSYRAIFYVNIPFILLALFFGGFYLQESYDETIAKRVDALGCLLLAAGLATLTFLLVKGNDYGWQSPRILILLLFSVGCILLFCIYEQRITNPMIDFRLFRTRTFTASVILIAVFFFAYMPVSYLMNFYFENTLGYTVLHAGLLMGIPSLVALLTAPLMPFFAKKMTPAMISLISILIAAAGNFLFTLMNRENHMLITIFAFILLGFGVRIATILYQTAFEEIDNSKNGIASGIQNSFRQLSACIAIALVATLSSHFTATAATQAKSRILEELNRNTVLTQEVKDRISTAVESAGGASSDSLSAKTVHDYFEKAVQAATRNMDTAEKQALAKQVSVQEQATDKFLSSARNIKTEESYRVYNKCFLITGIASLFGLLAVPFNRKKKQNFAAEESGLSELA